ncbi:hypothetical protein GCM10023195_11270 [Actinoallomurus liliacearum]|uniref:CinY protein n=1 Tax=Actinoallomurus liliacearum TaxID=1080073 RepID=A0ABP8TDD5_9ACTN
MPNAITAATVAAAAATVLLVGTAPRAHAFGTVGHLAEHERITRAALGCASGAGSDCFEPRSLDQVAGKKGTFGAVGSPDNPLTGEILTSAAHCDNADYVDGPDYRPQDRQRATAALIECVDHARARVRAGLRRAADLLDRDGRIKPGEVSLKPSLFPPRPNGDCTFNRVSGRAKCDVIEEFGRALHAVQDFYSHSNWADQAAAGPVGVHNPPGGRQGGVSPLFALFGAEPTGTNVPGWLTTGCFDAQAAITGERAGCTDGGRTRLKHAWINKDHGVIDARTGVTSCTEDGKNVCTARGQVQDNFSRAVRLAIDDTRRQWHDFAAAVRQTYPGRGDRIICALTHDDPTTTCH